MGHGPLRDVDDKLAVEDIEPLVGIRGSSHQNSVPKFALCYADLIGAQLQGATLDKASFACADLRGAMLRGASLKEARLQNAKLGSCSTRSSSPSCARVTPVILGQVENLWDDLRTIDLDYTALREGGEDGVSHVTFTRRDRIHATGKRPLQST